MLFSLLFNIKMPTFVGILTFMNRKNCILRNVEHVFFINSGSGKDRLFLGLHVTNFLLFMYFSSCYWHFMRLARAKLQIKISIDDNLDIFFSHFSMKIYVVTPHLEESQMNGSNEGFQHMFLWEMWKIIMLPLFTCSTDMYIIQEGTKVLTRLVAARWWWWWCVCVGGEWCWGW